MFQIQACINFSLHLITIEKAMLHSVKSTLLALAGDNNDIASQWVIGYRVIGLEFLGEISFIHQSHTLIHAILHE